jgi:hypothetical protein
MQVFDFQRESYLRELILLENFSPKKLNLGSFCSSKGYIDFLRHGNFMTQFNRFASKLRIQTLLSCCAAVLLSACGGGTDMTGSQLTAMSASGTTNPGAAAATTAAATAVPASTAAAMTAAPSASSAAVEAVAEAAPGAGTETATSTASVGAARQAGEVTTQAFELTGHDSNPPEPQAAQQDESATPPATTRQ